jgi:hypothetical protein
MKFINSFGRITGHQAPPPDNPKIRSLHRFSDSWLHNLLLIAVLLLALLAVVRALSFGVAVWELEPVVVQGHSQPLPSGPASTPQR